MLSAERLSFGHGDVTLFEDLNFVVHAGQRVAIAGRNGAGKSTLFQMMRGNLTADTGSLDIPSAWQIAWLDQEVVPTDRPALAYVVDGHKALREVEREIAQTEDTDRLAVLHTRLDDLGGYQAEARAGEILSGLGFATAEFDKPYSDFSGGWRIRLNLAQTLMTPCDLLLLDEPTNHLDLETIVWLEQWLRRFDGTVVVIAHDRAFLDSVAQHTLYLSHGGGKLYAGNYSSSERQRAEQMALEQAIQAKRAAQAAHMQKFIDRFRYKASKAKQAQSRIKALEKLEFTITVQTESSYRVAFQNPKKVSNPLFSLRNVAFGYAEKTVLANIGQTILPGDRIGILGVNGAGKTTLLRGLVGELDPQSGEFARGTHSEIGYFAQHQLESLPLHQTPLAHLALHRPEWREQQCRDFLGGWGFNAEMLARPINTLSGGEKARLVLAMIALQQPAILVLDEPTNHLDLDMRDALAMALQDYEGAVVIVSHDRVLLEKTVDEFWLIDQGQVTVYDGDMTDYQNLNLSQPKKAEERKPSHDKKAQRQARAANRQALNQQRKALGKLESEMTELTAALQAIEVQLADKETYDTLPAEELDKLLRHAGKLRSQLEATETEWLAAAEALEASS